MDIVRSTFATVTDASGVTRPWEGSLLPKVTMGPLPLTDVTMGLSPNSALLGQDILRRYPWAVDMSGGTWVIGAPVPASGAALGQASLREAMRGGDTIALGINGQETLFTLDTGADSTCMDGNTAIAMGLPFEKLERTQKYQTVHQTVTILGTFRTHSLRLGAFELVPGSISPLLDKRVGGALNDKIVGLLGMDRIGAYRFVVDTRDRDHLLGAQWNHRRDAEADRTVGFRAHV